MSKIEISPLPSGFASTTAIDSRFELIEDALNNEVLYRDNPDGEPNEMHNLLDMAGFDIINLPLATLPTNPVRLDQVDDLIASSPLWIDLDARIDGIDALIDDIEGVNSIQDSRLTAVEGVNSIQDGRLTAIEAVNTIQDGRLTTNEAALANKAPLSHVGSAGSDQHAVVTDATSGFMSPTLLQRLRGYPTVASLATATALIGTHLKTNGCLVTGDGGHGFFVSEVASGTPDGYSRVLLADGNHAVLQPINGCVDLHQFGIDTANVRFALTRADLFCQATGYKLVGSGSGLLSGIPILSAPYIDLSNFTIILEDDFGLTVGVIYEALPTAIDARVNVQMRFDGNRDNQTTPVIAFRITSCATPDSVFHIYGDNCNTLCNAYNNVERCEIHVKGVDTDVVALDSGSSPDTNVWYISGGNYKQLYVQETSTTYQLYLNAQTQDSTSTKPAIELKGTRGGIITGELRIIHSGALICGEDSGFVPTSSDLIRLNLIVHSALGTAPVFDFRRANRIEGQISVNICDPQPVRVGAVQSADLNIGIFNCEYTGDNVKLGDQAALLAASGKYSIVTRGANPASKIALIDRCSELDIYVSGSALPITVSSTVSNSIVNLSLPRAFVTQNVPVTSNGVFVNGQFRGMLLTTELLSYLTAVTSAGIPRGMKAHNVNTNSNNFFDGTVWKYAPTTTTLV